MLLLEMKKIYKIQLKEITEKFFCEFYKEEKSIEIILLVYDGDNYYTNVSFEEVNSSCGEENLDYFLECVFRNKSVDAGSDSMKRAEQILKSNKYIHYVLLNNNDELNDTAYFYTDLVWSNEIYKANIIEQKEMLQNKGIRSYFIKIPRLEELEENSQHSEWTYGKFLDRINWVKSRERKIKCYLSKFTDLEYNDIKNWIKDKKKSDNLVKEAERTIFLIGPCIVDGWESLPGDSLCEIMQRKLLDAGLNYNVKKVVVWRNMASTMNAVLEYRIRYNDIVLFIDDVIDAGMEDLNLTHIYNNYKGDKWLYSNLPIHSTRIANELIAGDLLENIIKPISAISESKLDQIILHEGEKQLTYEEFVVAKKYVDDLKKCTNEFNGTIGACIMTCNPFTKGHYHLIEFASKKVDILYIFVVEEDAFMFSFDDRIEMVRRGVKNIKNVKVFPGGKIIVSKATFRSYFEREMHSDDVIDAAKDILFFKKYLVPALRISKRFVGEEPIDNVTNQYHQQLKEKLTSIIEVVEIPRKTIDGEVISGSKVRKYYVKKDWDSIAKMVPLSTLNYLQENSHKFREKKVEDESLVRVVDFIRKHDNVIICGLGEDAKNLMQKLDLELESDDLNKLEFYDQKAEKINYTYRGKKVISFNELIESYRDYYMVITTSKYRKEIFCKLRENNVISEHIQLLSEQF